jgi:CBS domain-containing protein
MDGYGRDYRGGRPGERGPRRGYDVWYVPDGEPQAGMFPGPWGEGRFAFRRGDAWYDEDYQGHTGAEGYTRERRRHPGGQGGYAGYGQGGGFGFSQGYGQGGGYAEAGHGYGRQRGGYEDAEGYGPRSDSDRICAWQIMTENPETVTPETTLAEVSRIMRDLDVGILPVVAGGEDDGRLLGVITDRDIVVRALADGRDGSATVSGYMTTNIESVGRNDTVHDVLNVMKRVLVRRVPVTDDEGRLVGIIAQADLAVTYAGLDLQREAEVEEAIERISEPRSVRGPRPGRPGGVRRAQRY